jgi:hypothetical protein
MINFTVRFSIDDEDIEPLRKYYKTKKQKEPPHDIAVMVLDIQESYYDISGMTGIFEIISLDHAPGRIH